MRLKSLWVDGFKNLNGFDVDFELHNGITVLIGNNGSGKSNIIEAVSAIFAGLYQPKAKHSFNFKIKYEIGGVFAFVEHDKTKYNFKVNDDAVDSTIFLDLEKGYLPSQVIASYSGEENRLWKDFYKPSYDVFVGNIIKSTLHSIPKQRMFYVNKYYWDIALLTFFYAQKHSDNNDCVQYLKDITGIESISAVTIKFDTTRISYFKSNAIVENIKLYNPELLNEITLPIDDVVSRDVGYERDFFSFLASAYMPKDSKLITDIDITFNNGLKSTSLSEGEKKLILIKAILEFLADENSLVLLDEPDSHIHISRKEHLKNLLAAYDNRSNIITTHSPTLAHSFDINHITMLTKTDKGDVRVEAKEKQEIIAELTDGIWSSQEQNIFLATNKDLILVEGKTDITYIRTALDKLKSSVPEYRQLDFEFIPFGGADSLQHFVSKFVPARNQTIIALLDRDEAGKKAAEAVLQKSVDTKDFKQKTIKKMTIAMLPFKDGWATAPFIIEDYFNNDDVETLRKNIMDNRTEPSFAKYPDVKDTLKKKLPAACVDYDYTKFLGFKSLFDLILKIKAGK